MPNRSSKEPYMKWDAGRWVLRGIKLLYDNVKLLVWNLSTWIEQELNTLEEIQERHDAVKEIERKLLDLHQVSFFTLFFSFVLVTQLPLVGFPKSLWEHCFSSVLLQIYMDLAVLVEAQGELLDNIEAQVNKRDFISSTISSVHRIFLSFKLTVSPLPSSYMTGYKCGRSCKYGHRCSEHSQELAEEVEEMHDDLHHTAPGHCPHHRAPNHEAMEEIMIESRTLDSTAWFVHSPEGAMLRCLRRSRGILERFKRWSVQWCSMIIACVHGVTFSRIP